MTDENPYLTKLAGMTAPELAAEVERMKRINQVVDEDLAEQRETDRDGRTRLRLAELELKKRAEKRKAKRQRG